MIESPAPAALSPNAVQDLPLVTVVVPCRDEKRSVEACVRSILAQDYPRDRMEVLVVDGMSRDGTRAAVSRIAARDSRIRLLDNPSGTTPAALNIGVHTARGRYIVRVDAHTTLEPDYVRQCVERLEATGADNVGGLMRAMREGYVGKAIALAHHCRFGLGGGRFHHATQEEEADTVYMGAFRRDVFDRVGLFNEDLLRGQDIEMNYRIRRAGGRVLLAPAIRSSYRNRSTLGGLWRQYVANGMWNVRVAQVAPGALSLRHWVPLAFVLALVGALLLALTSVGVTPLLLLVGLYLLLALGFSAGLTIRHGLRFLFVLPAVFACLHVSYGVGYLAGFWRFALPAEDRLMSRRAWVATGLVLLGASALYAKTLAPTITWGDPAKLVNFAYTLYLNPSPNSHALHNMIGWLWGKLPFADYAFGQNLLNAIVASVAVAGLFLVAYRITRSLFAAFVAASAIAVSHTFWWMAAMNESYAPLYFFLAVCILCAVLWVQTRQERWLYLFAFTLMLSAGNNTLLLALAPAFAAYFLLTSPKDILRWRPLLLLAVSAIIGYLPMLYVFYQRLQWQSPQALLAFATSTSMFYYHDLASTPSGLLRYIGFLVYQFPSPVLLLGFAGMAATWRRDKRLFALLAGIFALDVGLVSGYMRQRAPELLVPSYVVFALMGAVALEALLKGRAWRALEARLRGPAMARGLLATLCVVLPLAAYYATPSVLQALRWEPLGIRTLPYRDNARYFYLPDKSGYDGARRFAEEVFATVAPNAIVVADFTPLTPLAYVQMVEKKRPDVTLQIVSTVIDDPPLDLQFVKENIEKRPIYLVAPGAYPAAFRMAELARSYDLVPQGVVFRLTPRNRAQ
ncbi:MAG: glycosyltransferase [Chloroflexi bacterium]|nr:glycosyltransferase [Chloroflexota bacterium]